MKAICCGVMDSAAMIRSASFSREGSSRTMTNWPSPGEWLVAEERGDGGTVRKAEMTSGMESNWDWGIREEGILSEVVVRGHEGELGWMMFGRKRFRPMGFFFGRLSLRLVAALGGCDKRVAKGWYGM